MGKTRKNGKPNRKVARFTVRTVHGKQIQFVHVHSARRWAAELRFRMLNLPEDDPDRPEDFRYIIGQFAENQL